MRTVRLYGELGRRFGRVHRFAVNSAAEAVRALRVNFPEFENAVMTISERYRVIVGRRRLDAGEQLQEPSGDADTIRIIPVVQGAKRGGLFQTVIGVALIVASFIPGNPFSSVMLQSGIALTLGGVAQMLTPTPKQQAGQEAESKNSYVFSGAVNVTAQGFPVPVGYGRMIVGSAVISAGLSTQEYAG